MKQRLGAVGFFGEGNLGDEAILEGIQRALLPGWELISTSGDRVSRVSGKKIPRTGLGSWFPFLKTLRNTRKIVFSGGILQDWSWQGVTFFALRILAANAGGASTAVFGGGLGPLRNPFAVSLSKKALRYLSVSWWRDLPSKSFFEELVVNQGNLGTDWSWNIPIPNPNPISVSCQPSCKPVGINLRPWFSTSFQEIVREKLSIYQSYKPFIGISARAEDERLMRHLFPNLRVSSPKSFAELVKLSQGLEAGWAMRYHVVLAMIRANIAVAPLRYDGKVEHLCNEAGIPQTEDLLPVSSQKLAENVEGAKRPTAGDEGCEVRAQNLAPLLHPEGGRVPPFFEKSLFLMPANSEFCRQSFFRLETMKNAFHRFLADE